MTRPFHSRSKPDDELATKPNQGEEGGNVVTQMPDDELVAVKPENAEKVQHGKLL